MPDGRVDYGRWLLRIVGWDGLLPMVIVAIPLTIEALTPRWHDAIAVIAVGFPIFGFFVRLIVGGFQIEKNHCSEAVRVRQIMVLFGAIFLLAVVDCFLILAPLFPKGFVFETPTARVYWTLLGLIYLPAIAFAMYPGVKPVAEADFGPPPPAW